MKKPLVSVIIPHFNRTRLLVETLASVQKQSLEDWEVIVVDDVSDKEEWNRLQEFREERITILQRGNQFKGPSACRNIGIRAARGEFVVFLDSDDLLEPWCLETRVKDFRGNPELDFLVYFSLLFEHTPGDNDRLWNYTDAESDQLERFLYSDIPWCVTGPVWKRETLIQLGGFNENVFYGDDAELHIRAILERCSFKIFSHKLPDNFIRRSEENRITSAITSDLLESRLVYLETVRELLQNKKVLSKYIKIWEGEFFRELEFRIFNRKQNSLMPVLISVNGSFTSKFLKKWIAAYCYVTVLRVDRNYLFFKIIRKFFLFFLPSSYTDRKRKYPNSKISEIDRDKLFYEIENV